MCQMTPSHYDTPLLMSCDCINLVSALSQMLLAKAFCKTGVLVFSTRGHLTAVEYMFKKYIEKLRTHDPACPLCHRPFDEQTEVEELISEARMFAFWW